MSRILSVPALANYQRVSGIYVPSEPPPPSYDLLGFGSVSTSLVDYPKIADTTVGFKYVDGSRPSSGDGSSLATAYKTIQEGLAALTNGQKLIVKGGTYSISGTGITRSTAWASPTYVMAYGSDVVILEGSGIDYNRSVLTFSGSVNEIWHGFWVRDRQAGFLNDGQSVRFIDGAHDCKLSRFRVSHCAQTGVFGYNAYNIQVLDSAVWRLGDGSDTGTNAPDGFALTGDVNAGLPGIRYVRCIAAFCPDDSFDHYRNQGALDIDCVSYKAGYYWNNNPGADGNGFKLGSNETNTKNNGAIGCLALGSRNNGFDDNATDENNTLLRNTAADCGGTGFQVGSGLGATVHDNIAVDNGLDYKEWAAIADSYNSWNLGITDPLFGDPSSYDRSLLAGSDALGAGISGGNLGASDVALAIAKEYIPFILDNL